MAVDDVQRGSNLCLTTHVGRKEDNVCTLRMTIEDIKSKIVSYNPGQVIKSGSLECGNMEFRLTVYPNQVGFISVGAAVKNRGERLWKSFQFQGAENSTGHFLRTQTSLLEDLMKRQQYLSGITMSNFLSHEMVMAEENLAFFPNGVLTVKLNIKVQGEETMTHKITKLPDESITSSQLKGELSGHLRKMMDSHQFSDFKIICQGEIIHCHRNMLAARSDIFGAMFEHDMKESTTGEVEIKDFELETVQAVLLFIYTGEVEYNEENTKQLIRAADYYQLQGLKKKIEDVLIKAVKVENAIDMFVLGDGAHADKLRDVSKEVIVRNAFAIVKIDGWKEKLGRFQGLLLEIFESVANSMDQTK